MPKQLFQKGNKFGRLNKGKRKTEGHKRKISESKKGIHLTEETKRKISKILTGRKLTKEWKKKIGLANSGEKNYRWIKDRSLLKERQKEYCKKWYQDNKERLLKQSKKWYKNNKERKLKIAYRLRKKKRGLNPAFRFYLNITTAISVSLKGKKAGRHWEKLVGYTLKDLMKHLESQFDDKMSWDNYGAYWWLDHIKPRSLFQYNNSKDKEFKKCWALENLQPMEKIRNIKKGNKYAGY